MFDLLAALRLALFEVLDPFEHLRHNVTDKNLILTGYKDEWMVLDANGTIIVVGTSAIDVVAQLSNY